ncbi:MAG: carbohydrate kinase family protein [Euryarchaeota archaeon]|nr:carbohydrate kinase family protein [Euryarchaeota archaeon]
MIEFDVVGFGALNVDKLYSVNKIAYEDEESYILGFQESCGGSAANTIIGLSRLGLHTGFIGKVSKDRDGNLLIKNLVKEKVDTRGIIVSKEGKSGKVLGFVDLEGQRALYVDPGVNDLIKTHEIKSEYLSNSKILHLTSFVGKSIKAQKNLINKINKISKDVTITLDPGRLYTEKGPDYIKDILKRTNIILLNEKELENLTTNENEYKSCEEKAKILLEYGINIVVVKSGERGCYITDGEENHFIEAFKAVCVDTTGAGDAFNAGFLYSFIKGKNLRECCEIGNFVAACCIQKYGTINGLPEISNLNEMNLEPSKRSNHN